jgi:hypothetical protein
MASLNRRNTLLSFLLAFQFIGVGIWIPTHGDTDCSVWPGQANILEHRDNGPCRDVPLSHEDYCAICAAAQGRVSFKPIHVPSPQLQVLGHIEILAFVTPSQQLHLDSFSRRGPPSLLA